MKTKWLNRAQSQCKSYCKLFKLNIWRCKNATSSPHLGKTWKQDLLRLTPPRRFRQLPHSQLLSSRRGSSVQIFHAGFEQRSRLYRKFYGYPVELDYLTAVEGQFTWDWSMTSEILLIIVQILSEDALKLFGDVNFASESIALVC